jgi:hypothetical protein
VENSTLNAAKMETVIRFHPIFTFTQEENINSLLLL